MLALRLTQKLLTDMKVAPIDLGEVKKKHMAGGKTNDRSVLGTMKEMSLYYDGIEFDHTFDLSAWLNKMIYKPIGYEEPVKVYKESLIRKYS